MPTELPKILKNFNMMVDGRGYAGKCEEVTLPTLTVKEEDFRAGGMDGTLGLDMGTEKLELKASFAEHNPEIFAQFGLVHGGATQVIFRGAQADDKTVQAYTVEASGSLRVIAPAAAKAGDKNPVEVTFSLRYYKLSIGGRTVIEIDVLGMKRVVGGVDVLAQMRNLIG